MTVITQEFGYLDDEYLDLMPYLTGHVFGNMGFQVNMVIADFEKPLGMQAKGQIVDSLDESGFQTSATTVDFLNNQGFQSQMVIESDTALGFQSSIQILDFLNNIGFQSLGNIADFLDEFGFQAEAVTNIDDDQGFQASVAIIDFLNNNGFQATSGTDDFLDNEGYEFRADAALVHLTHGKYLVESEPYLTTSYLADLFCVLMGFQVEMNIIDFQKPTGFQTFGGVIDALDEQGFQTQFNIKDTLDEFGFQTEFNIVDTLDEFGFQASLQIVDFLNNNGFQFEGTINDEVFYGFQVESQSVEGFGFQIRSAIYNTTNLRIMCEFPSRGVLVNNWTANFTAATGDFDVNNVNTDIEEQVWRSEAGVNTGIQLECDTGVVQGISTDTVFIAGTNLTTSATVTLNGSNSSIFASIDRIITLAPLDNGRMYHISTDLPLTQQRYWRLDIDDPTNTNDPQIGIILFGASVIFSGECFVDQIGFQQKDFTKTVRTEGHTNVTISRSQKRVTSLDFRDLDVGLGNYSILREIFEDFRTTLKCVWIPTPSPTNQTETDRYAVFAKLAEIPSEQHNNKGPGNTHASFGVNLDESL